MDILKQCEVLKEKGEYKKIIDLLENVPEDNYTIEVTMELARAHLDTALDSKEPDKTSLEIALSIFLSIKDEQKEDVSWNHSIGLAYYFLHNEMKALPYLRFASENLPEDKMLTDMIESCESKIALSDFSSTFKERTQLAWKVFYAKEPDILDVMSKSAYTDEYSEQLVAMVSEIFNIAITDISFEIGFNGEKNEIIFSPEGIRLSLFYINYFVNHAPEQLKERWSFLVGRSCIPNAGIRIEDMDVSGEDVQVLVEKKGDDSVALTLYCEKLLPQLKENETAVWQILSILTDQMLGELSAMAYIESLYVVDNLSSDKSISLSKLADKLYDLGMKSITDPNEVLESYLTYELKPDEDTGADFRLDIIVGNSNCFSLIGGYLNNDNEDMEELYENGVAAGFLAYSLDTLIEEEGTDRIFDFRESLIEYLEDTCGEDNIYVTGGATGIYCGYVDFIAWDLRNVLDAAVKFFKNSEIRFAAYHSFVREAEALILVE